jgi:hypothetical protein
VFEAIPFDVSQFAASLLPADLFYNPGTSNNYQFCCREPGSNKSPQCFSHFEVGDI